MSFEDIQNIISRYDTDEIKVSNAYEDGGLDPLWPRLERAALNQAEEGLATFSRYGIWGNTVRDNIREAMSLMESGEFDDAFPLLIRAANSLSAFSEIQATLGRSCDDE